MLFFQHVKFYNIFKNFECKLKCIYKGIPPTQKQLTVKQANNSRLVTKVRWVLEGRNGHLETFKALGEVKNNSLSHIMEDYKIAAAIINCFYTKLISDKKNTIEIAECMKSKLKKSFHLEKYLLEIKKDNFQMINTTDITDFPKLNYEMIKNELTCGSYQLKTSYSYLAEHFKKNGKYVILAYTKNSSDENKIILSKIQSRHINRIQYNVIIEYIPNLNESKAIVEWFCTCKVGKRTVGCCSHVTCIVYYLSSLKYDEKLKNPGKGLDDLLISLSSEESEKENTQNSSCKRSLKSRILTSISMNEIEEKKSKVVDTDYDETVNSLIRVLPRWGGNIAFDKNDFNPVVYSENQSFMNLKIINTCTIDYFMLAIAFSCDLNKNIYKIIDTANSLSEKLKMIIDLISANEWNRAKTLWILEILKITPKRRTFDTFGEEFDCFIKHIKELQCLNYYCRSEHCNDNIFYTNDEFYFENDENNNLTLSFDEKTECRICKTHEHVFKSLGKSTPWLFIQNLVKFNNKPLTIYDLPNEIRIEKNTFKLLMCTFNVGLHFKSIFKIKDEYYLFDDLIDGLSSDINNHQVSSCFYYLT